MNVKQFKKVMDIPNKELPTAADECENIPCTDCVLYEYINNAGVPAGCQFSHMLSDYKEA